MDSFGLERSIEPRHALAQQAWKIDNTMTLRSDEVLIDVKIININLASFNEILDETGEDRALLCQRVLEIVRERGKLHNPVTNSGGMLYGTVVELGPSYPNIYHIRPKDEIISIIRLSAKGTDGVMKRRCFRLKLMFAILFTGVLGILQRPWR
ncbi:hypothetical protein PND81_20915 [Flavonifractor plautii]|uniref:hypothetical protein n=1 Tax=Flavonifractor plautii TaxID=292800 RepID=UPI001FAD1335|nr:hypothetical protein [Flavonifractor plautii]MDB7903778.1 hypothetical protein [Flavonifractor plautii]